MYHLVGTLRTDKTNKIKGYIILRAQDNYGGTLKAYNPEVTKELLSRFTVLNLRLEEGELKADGGFDRYATFKGNSMNMRLDKSAMVILGKYMVNGEAVGYRVMRPGFGFMEVELRKVAEYISNFGNFSNAKVGESGKLVPFHGSFQEIDLGELTSKYADKRSLVDSKEFVWYFKRLGWDVVSEGSTITVKVPSSGGHLEYLKMPSFRGEYIVFKGGKITIEKLHHIGSLVCRVIFENDGTEIGEYILDATKENNFEAHGNEVTGNVVINRLYNVEAVRKIDWVSLNCTVKLVSLQGEKLRVNGLMGAYTNESSVGAIDFSRLGEGSEVLNSFRGCSGVTHVRFGKTLLYLDVLHDTKIRLHNFFSEKARVISGFNKIEDIKELDFSSFRYLSEIKQVDGSQVEKFKFPTERDASSGTLNVIDICREAPVTDLSINVKSGRVRIERSFAYAEKIVTEGEINSKIYLYNNGKNTNLEVYVKKSEKSTRADVPMIRGKSYTVRIEEGVEEVLLENSMWCEGVHFPKSLRVIKRGNGGVALVKNWNLHETQLEHVGAFFASGTSFNGDILELPKSLKSVGEEALKFNKSMRVYIPQSLNQIGSRAFNISVAYLHKDSYADKKIKGKVIKEYVRDAKEIGELRSTQIEDSERSKIILVGAGDEETNKWREDGWDNYEELVKLRYEGTSALGYNELGIELDRSKFIEFKLSALGDFGTEIRKRADKGRKFLEVGDNSGTSGVFNLLSNLITANTEMVPGAFTKKMLDEIVIEDSEPFLYNDGKSYIVFLRLSNTKFLGKECAAGILIVEDGVVRYATAVGDVATLEVYKHIIYKVLSRGVLEKGILGRVVVGDYIGYMGVEHGMETVGLLPVPSNLIHKSNRDIGEVILEVGRNLILSINSGRLIHYDKKKEGGRTSIIITKIEEYGDYELGSLLAEIFDSENMKKMYDVFNGKEYKVGKIEIQKHYAVGLLEELKNGEIDYEKFQKRVMELGAVEKTKIHAGYAVEARVDNEKFAEAVMLNSTSRVDLDAKTYYAPWSSKWGHAGSKITVMHCKHSAKFWYDKREELLKSESIDIEVGATLEGRMVHTDLIIPEIYSKNLDTRCLNGDWRVRVFNKNTFLGFIVNTLRARKMFMEWEELRYQYRHVSRFNQSKEASVLSRIAAEDSDRTVFKLALKIINGEELSVEEQRLAALIAYGVQGVLGEMGFEKV